MAASGHAVACAALGKEKRMKLPRSQSVAVPRAQGLQISEIALMTGLAVLAPFFAHLIPSWDDSPMGARLLPIFYAPLLAAMLHRAHVSIIVALAAPWVNHMLLGMPPLPIARVLTVELLVFSILVLLISQRTRKTGGAWVGPAAYLLTMGVLYLVFLVAPALNPAPTALAYVSGAVKTAWPGIIILGLLSWGAHKIKPTQGPMAHA